MKKAKGSVYLNIFFIILAAAIIYSSTQSDKEGAKTKDKESIEYPFIEESSQEFRGEIYDINQSKYWAGAYLITLTNGQNFSIGASTINYEYGKVEAMKSLEIGDSVYKPINSDSLLIHRENKKYYFILVKNINN